MRCPYIAHEFKMLQRQDGNGQQGPADVKLTFQARKGKVVVLLIHDVPSPYVFLLFTPPLLPQFLNLSVLAPINILLIND